VSFFAIFKISFLAVFERQSNHAFKSNKTSWEGTASSTQTPTEKYGLEFAFDSIYGRKFFFLSRDEPYPWIEIDIKEKKFIQRVLINCVPEDETLTRYSSSFDILPNIRGESRKSRNLTAATMPGHNESKTNIHLLHQLQLSLCH